MKPPTEMALFRDSLMMAKSIVILTGAGVSAESGIPTFRGAGGFWRRYQSSALASPDAFKKCPSLVWEFYQYRRDLALNAAPNAGHIAIAKFEERYAHRKNIVIITQNVDGLHHRAGSKNLIELHGSLFKTRCTKCKEILYNTDNPICEALAHVGPPDLNVLGSTVPAKDLPHCKNAECGGLLRPHIVWFGEGLEPQIIEDAEQAVKNCDVCLVAGTSSLVQPAAALAPQAAAAGAVVAEFNVEQTNNTHNYPYFFQGECGATLKEALARFD